MLHFGFVFWVAVGLVVCLEWERWTRCIALLLGGCSFGVLRYRAPFVVAFGPCPLVSGLACLLRVVQILVVGGCGFGCFAMGVVQFRVQGVAQWSLRVVARSTGS